MLNKLYNNKPRVTVGIPTIELIKNLRTKGIKKIYCICVHGLFIGNAYNNIKKSGVKKVITTNTIPNKTSEININNLIIKKIK